MTGLLSKKLRCEQGSNLCGKIQLDFKSNALTTRPSQLDGKDCSVQNNILTVSIVLSFKLAKVNGI